MLEEFALRCVLVVHGVILRELGVLTLEELVLSAFTQPVIIQISVQEGLFALLVLLLEISNESFRS